MRLALIGAGRIAHSHLAAIDAVEGASLSVIVEPLEDVAAPIAEKHGAKWLANHTAGDLDKLCDGAILCSPPSTHHALASHLLERGVPVLCEKPLDLSSAGAKRLFALAASKNTTLMMASKFRYVDDVMKAKSMIAAGELGRIIGYHNAFSGRVEMANRWNIDPKISGGGVLMDNGTHSVDIARYLLGPITAVQAERHARVQPIDVEDACSVLFRASTKHSGDVVGQISLTWSAQLATSTFIDIYGTEGTVLIGWGESKHKLGSGAFEVFGRGYDKNAAFANQLQNFMDVVAGRGEPRVAAADAIASVSVIEAAYASMNSDKWTKIA